MKKKAKKTMKGLKSFNLKKKKVIVRCDFNVPLGKNQKILDDFRIRKALPAISYLIEKGARVILISHLGKPQKIKSKTERIKKLTLKPVAKRLSFLLKRKIKFLPDCLGKKVKREISILKGGELVLLENLRFYKEEEENNKRFARALAELAEIYINEAFGTAHRAHASIVGIPCYLPSGAGFLFEKEIEVLSRALYSPLRPFVVIIGGAKIESKLGVIGQFLKKADHVLLGGEIANIILSIKGLSPVSKKIEDKKLLKKIKTINLTNSRLHLPVDGIISSLKLDRKKIKIGAVGKVNRGEKIYDIGPETIKIFSQIIKRAKMILWAGPLGMIEERKFAKGTKGIIEAIIKNKKAFKIAGGGDTDSAVLKFSKREKFDHLSTGGGAMLKFLSGEKLPGIEALNKKR